MVRGCSQDTLPVYAHRERVLPSLIRYKDLSCSDTGAVLFESTLLIPLFILCAIGIYSFGVDFWEYSSIVDGTRVAARTAASYRGSQPLCNVVTNTLEQLLDQRGTDDTPYQVTLEELDLTENSELAFGSAESLPAFRLSVERARPHTEGLWRFFGIPKSASVVFYLESGRTFDESCLTVSEEES